MAYRTSWTKWESVSSYWYKSINQEHKVLIPPVLPMLTLIMWFGWSLPGFSLQSYCFFLCKILLLCSKILYMWTSWFSSNFHYWHLPMILSWITCLLWWLPHSDSLNHHVFHICDWLAFCSKAESPASKIYYLLLIYIRMDSVTLDEDYTGDTVWLCPHRKSHLEL